MTKLDEVRTKAHEHEGQTGHQVIETDTSSYDVVGVAVICRHCAWNVSEEWPRGQHGPTADYGDDAG